MSSSGERPPRGLGPLAQTAKGASANKLLAKGAGHVLVVGPDDWAVDDATSQLVACGWAVHRCHDSAGAPLPCNALVPGRGCPLDVAPVDVVLDVRSRAQTDPTLAEMGAICGLRSGTPLVMAGLSERSSLAPWAVTVPPDGDLVATCEAAARAKRRPPRSGRASARGARAAGEPGATPSSTGASRAAPAAKPAAPSW